MIISKRLQRAMPEGKDVYFLSKGENPSRLRSIWLGFSVVMAGLPKAIVATIWVLFLTLALSFLKMLAQSLLVVSRTPISVFLTMKAAFAGKLVMKDDDLAKQDAARRHFEQMKAFIGGVKK